MHGICGSVVDDDNENHRICSTCVATAGKRKAQQQTALGGHNLNAPRPRMRGVRSNGCWIFLGALPVVLFFFSSCSVEAGAPGRQEIICPDVVTAGVTAVVVMSYC